MSSKVWGEISCQFAHFNGFIEVWELISKLIAHFMMGYYIIYQWIDYLFMLGLMSNRANEKGH